MTTLGKYRHLSQCSTPNGKFVILAIDHRGNLLRTLQQQSPDQNPEMLLAATKIAIMRHLSPAASAVLTDPAYGLGYAILGEVSGQAGLLSPIEVTNYDVHPGQAGVMLLDDWSIGKIKRAGANGVKLLLYYHPDAPDAQSKRDFVAKVVENCDKYDIPFFHEPIAHSLDPQKPLDNSELRQVVIESARVFSDMGIDVLKTEFPINVKQESDEKVWAEAVAELNSVCKVPWALLSAGTGYDTFRKQAELACKAGASGVIVGRAIWNEAVTMTDVDQRDAFLATTAYQRMSELTQICEAHATNWKHKVTRPQINFDWYTSYPDL